MDKQYQDWMNQAAAKSENIAKQLKGFKKKKPKNLDELFHKEHQAVFRKVDCLKCANCCKTTSPIFRDIDIRRISAHMRMTASDFIKKFLKIDEDNDYVLQQSPCHFLMADNTCIIYENRPLACREYPHTDRKNINQILDLTRKNAEICPAVSNILLQINKSF
ncbi:YkgJ family cysteine cluster protein [Crocinitomicaceae bacterium CZZ-1]|uniref:YkgJ family cysteine cluster protein n=1 Tax=Taishania pollutisoli TaxID=2766479 RepID=A0A8J6TRN7_9FLAO|nr:YkgJ family cysteine cluster protein [Taishania pollutisoli]MBC9811257.1 YkgJ family cysteine cluster protein [Taishania pollutisoli]